MRKEWNEIMRHTGKAWLAQAIIDLAEGLNPTKVSDQKRVSRMLNELKAIRQYEQKTADKKASAL